MIDPLERAQSNEGASLSTTGLARRDRMLTELVGQMRQAHTARRTRRRCALAAISIVVLCVGAAVLSHHVPDPGSQSVSLSAIDMASPVRPIELPEIAARITRFHTSSDIVSRYATTAAHDSPAIVISIASQVSDEELLRMLAQIDRPTGMIRTDGRVWLTRHVADDDIAAPADKPANSS